jgi:hypothetical protein
MVLVEGENGDGLTVDEDTFDVDEVTAPQTSPADQVVSAILGTREGAAEGGYQLTSTGVTWTDPIDAAALRDALAAHKIENVMLVSAFLAAAALAQAVGSATNYSRTALLFVEPDTATLAVVDSSDGSIAEVHREALPDDDDAAVASLTSLVSGAEELDTRPDGVFVVGSGIDIPMIKPALASATSLPLTAPEEPETALARGAALASANAPLFSSSTAARAYAQDPGTGGVTQHAMPDYYEALAGGAAVDGLAYSAVPEDAPYTGEFTAATHIAPLPGEEGSARRSFTLVGSAVAAVFIIGVAALVVSLAVSIRPTAGVRPAPSQNVVAPTQQQVPEAPAPAPAAPPAPQATVPEAPAPVNVPDAPAPAPQAPVQVPQVQVPDAPAPAPVPVPAAPAPVVPQAPVPVPVPIPLPIFGAPGGGHGGFPGEGPRGGFGGPHGGGPGGGFPGGGGHGGFGGPGGGFGGGHGGGRGH